LKATVEAFSRAYAAASRDQQAALRVWMRNIILRGIARRDDLAKCRRGEKESIEARDRRLSSSVSAFDELQSDGEETEGRRLVQPENQQLSYQVSDYTGPRKGSKGNRLNGFLRSNSQALKGKGMSLLPADIVSWECSKMPRGHSKRSNPKTRPARKCWAQDSISTWRPRSERWLPQSHLVKVEPENAGWLDQSGICDTPS